MTHPINVKFYLIYFKMCECIFENLFSCPNNSMCCTQYIYKYDYISGNCIWESNGMCDLEMPFKNARRYDGHVYCDTGYFVECENGDSEPCGFKLPFVSTTCECVPVKEQNLNNEQKFTFVCLSPSGAPEL